MSNAKYTQGGHYFFNMNTVEGSAISLVMPQDLGVWLSHYNIRDQVTQIEVHKTLNGDPRSAQRQPYDLYSGHDLYPEGDKLILQKWGRTYPFDRRAGMLFNQTDGSFLRTSGKNQQYPFYTPHFLLVDNCSDITVGKHVPILESNLLFSCQQAILQQRSLETMIEFFKQNKQFADLAGQLIDRRNQNTRSCVYTACN